MNSLSDAKVHQAHRYVQDVLDVAMTAIADLERLVEKIDFDHKDWQAFVAKHRLLAMELMALQDKYGKKETR